MLLGGAPVMTVIRDQFLRTTRKDDWTGTV